MKPASCLFRVASIRILESGATIRKDIAMRTEIGADRIHTDFISSPFPFPREMAEAAFNIWRSCRDLLFPLEITKFTLEAGLTTWYCPSEDMAVVSEHHPYLLVTCRGDILYLETEWSISGNIPWWRKAESADIDDTLPVVFGSSAVLTLVKMLLENPCLDLSNTRIHPSISLLQVSHSPYPPHYLPLAFLGYDPWEREIIHKGTFLLRLEDLSFGEMAFLTNPEIWYRPFAALSADEWGSLKVICSMIAPMPLKFLMIESLIPLSFGGGATEWEATFSLYDCNRGFAAGDPSLRLTFDIHHILSRISGCLGACRPTLARDPILGDYFGLAPTLLFDSCASDLIGGLF
jgi:hypothetical protein